MVASRLLYADIGLSMKLFFSTFWAMRDDPVQTALKGIRGGHMLQLGRLGYRYNDKHEASLELKSQSDLKVSSFTRINIQRGQGTQQVQVAHNYAFKPDI
jgi:hypothetical protein